MNKDEPQHRIYFTPPLEFFDPKMGDAECLVQVSTPRTITNWQEAQAKGLKLGDVVWEFEDEPAPLNPTHSLDHELPDGNVCLGPLEPMTSVTDPNPCFMMPAGIIYPIESLVVASGGTIEEEDDLVGDGITNNTDAIQDVIDFKYIDILTGRPKYD